MSKIKVANNFQQEKSPQIRMTQNAIVANC